MKEAILPLFGYVLLQFFVTIVGLNVVREKRIGFSEALRSWVLGQMLLLALLQMLAVPMILARLRFDALFYSYVSASCLLFGFGCLRMKDCRLKRRKRRKRLSRLAVILIVIVVALIVCQSLTYFFGIHLDEDDARWLAEANDALEYGDMLTRNFYTGEYLGTFSLEKDVTSPWPMLFAVLSRILFSTRVSMIAHTVYAPIELIVMYAVYYLIARELFSKREACITFLLFVAIINLFYAGTVFTQSVFSLVRIWQGKATVAGVMIPLVLYLFIRINKRDKASDWFMLPVESCAACLMSGMGISLMGVMIGVYCVYHFIAYRNWKRISHFVLAELPMVVFALIYFYYKW